MRIAILSRNRSLYSTRRLAEACRARRCRADIIDPFDLFLVVEDRPRLFYRESGRPVDDVDLAIPRIGTALTEYGVSVIGQLEGMGIPVVNGARGLGVVRDKMRCLQSLVERGLPVPRTAMIRHPSQLPLALDRVGGPPVVLKLMQGSQGIGVMLGETRDMVESLLETLWSLRQVVLLQEFVAESRGRDIRALVVGGTVLAAMRRHARGGEFRSNIHRGGTGALVDLPDAYREVAVAAAGMAGLDVAGVDLLESAAGPKVMEINASPGFEGLEAATGIDVAGEIIRCGLAKVGHVRAGGDAASP